MLLTLQDWTVVNAIRYYLPAKRVSHSELARDRFTVWDISFEHQLNNTQSVSLSAHNITNKAYYASLDDDAPFQPKRHVKLSTRWQF